MRLESTIKRWIGDSTETKPRPGVEQPDGTTLEAWELPAGSSFYEENTGFISRWTGQVWTAPFPEPRSEEVQVLIAILEEIRAAREEARIGLPVLTHNSL